MRRHFRHFLRVRAEGEKDFSISVSTTLASWASSCRPAPPEQQREFFGPIQTFWAEDAAGSPPRLLGPNVEHARQIRRSVFGRAVRVCRKYGLIRTRLLSQIRAASDGRKPLTAGLPQPGDRIGQYRILAPLGQGGMGIVLFAEHETPDGALRSSSSCLSLRTMRFLAARFVREARAAKSHCPSQRGADRRDRTDRCRWPYLVMEYLSGETLAARLQRHKTSPAARPGDMASWRCAKSPRRWRHFTKTDWFTATSSPATSCSSPTPRFPAASGPSPGLWCGQDPRRSHGRKWGDSREHRPRPGPQDPRRRCGTPQYMAPEQWNADQALDGRLMCTRWGSSAFALSGRLPFLARARPWPWGSNI